ncbi:MAG: HAMP domain-containing protein, partial [Bacteroidetes bacterium]|nr:HAMP domain-containing protein [Bacteroidota bacterium]
MDWLLLTPESTRTASLVILNLASLVYLVRVPNPSAATRWLAAFTGGIVVFYVMRFVEASVYPLDAFGVLPHIRMAIETVIVPVALGAFAQFAYRFLEHPFRREARVVLWGTGGVVGGMLLYSLYALRLTPNPSSLYGLYSLVWFGYLVLATVVLLRKSRRSRQASSGASASDRTRRAYHAFAGLSAFFAMILVLITLLNGARVLPEWMWPLVILPGVFVFFCGLVVAYVNHAPEPTTVQVKLVGLSLATVLALLGMASVVLYPPGEMVRDSGVLPPDGQVVRFAPDTTGGYRVDTVTLPPDSALGPIGEPIPLNERNAATLPLGFSFPYAGAQWKHVTVGDLAVVIAGAREEIPPEGFRPYGSAIEDAPMIAPLFGMLPRRNLSDAQPPQVYLHRSPGRVVLTWQYEAPVGPSAPARVQLALHRDGAIHFAYDDLGFVASLTPVGPIGGLQGLQLGGEAPFASVRYVQGARFDLPAGTSALDDLGLRLRQYGHTKSVRLFGLLLGATVLILLVAPFVFRSGLLDPLRRLLDGVRRVDAGDLDVEVPVRVRDEVGTLTAHFNRMIASLRQAEAERQARADELEDRVAARTAELAASKEQVEQQAERLRELDALKTRFFANISHEFRTPLTLILSPLRDVLEGRAEAEAFARQAPVMHRNARRLLALINQLLDLAKLEAGGMDLRARPLDLGEVLRHLVLAFAPRAERDGLTLLFDAPDDAVVAPIDPDKLEHVVTNLLANAFKFTASGGKVRVACRAVAGASPSESGDGWAEITVEDTGRGIPADELPHIFDRFYQGEDSTTHDPGGTGIGLALAKELVELHGGTIAATSTVGFGTTFTVRLPLTSAPVASTDESLPVAEPSSQLSEAPAGKAALMVEDGEQDTTAEAEVDSNASEAAPATILIVEDHPDMRALVRDYLDAEYRVLEAEDGETGLDAAREATPDLIIADVMM